MMSGFRLKVFGLPALALLLFCGGCGGDTGPMAPEVDEPLYRQALQRKREGNTQEALADYLRVIVKRPGARVPPRGRPDLSPLQPGPDRGDLSLQQVP
jgi:hypothetical protein